MLFVHIFAQRANFRPGSCVTVVHADVERAEPDSEKPGRTNALRLKMAQARKLGWCSVNQALEVGLM
jgi:hypothetical protein